MDINFLTHKIVTPEEFRADIFISGSAYIDMNVLQFATGTSWEIFSTGNINSLHIPILYEDNKPEFIEMKSTSPGIHVHKCAFCGKISMIDHSKQQLIQCLNCGGPIFE